MSTQTELKSINRFPGLVNSGSYIIKFKDDVSKAASLSSDFTARHGLDAAITHGGWDESLFNGFAARLDEEALDRLKAHPDVEFIEEDGIMHTCVTQVQTGAPWGISRLSQNDRHPGRVTDAFLNSFIYRYGSDAGSGVDIYVVDTGINVGHVDFGGRASWGASFGGYPNIDDNGHGTHCAGTAAGKRWGVAKAANLIAVKVLNAAGSGSVSDIISGLDFVLSSVATSGRPSIASLSLGGGASLALDTAVTKLVRNGIHLTVAAGNDGVDAKDTSPARAPAVNTIGAVDIKDQLASFSNFGPIVDLLAPGVNITSAWTGSTTAVRTISGTSMATPHVAGLIAYLIGNEGNFSPAVITARLKELADADTIHNNQPGTVNLLARNDLR